MGPPEKLKSDLSYIKSIPWKDAVSFVQSTMNWTYEKARGFVLDLKQGFVF